VLGPIPPPASTGSARRFPNGKGAERVMSFVSFQVGVWFQEGLGLSPLGETGEGFVCDLTQMSASNRRVRLPLCAAPCGLPAGEGMVLGPILSAGADISMNNILFSRGFGSSALEQAGWGFYLRARSTHTLDRHIYCRVCGRKLCYTEYVINNWISVVPLAADPFIGLRSFLFPAVPEKAVIEWIFEFT
jgi:hypothetical protein